MFYPGGGRPKGSLSWKTVRVQEFCRLVVEDPGYRRSILERARTNNLGSMEPVIWAYGYGKPKETVQLQIGQAQDDLSGLTTEELKLRAEGLVRQLIEAQDTERYLAERGVLPELVAPDNAGTQREADGRDQRHACCSARCFKRRCARTTGGARWRTWTVTRCAGCAEGRCAPPGCATRVRN